MQAEKREHWMRLCVEAALSTKPQHQSSARRPFVEAMMEENRILHGGRAEEQRQEKLKN